MTTISNTTEEQNAIEETLYLESIPGMRESIIEGLQTPLEECSEELTW
jgi:antitoxin YefM